MQTGGMTELPLIWKPFLSTPLAMILVIAVPAVLAGVIGFFIFRNRIKGVYFSIISQALTWAAYSLFTGLQSYTGGNVGITEITSLLGSIKGDSHRGKMFIMFYSSLAILVLIYALSAFLMQRKFGKLLIAIRDGENRTYFSGYCVSRYKKVDRMPFYIHIYSQQSAESIKIHRNILYFKYIFVSHAILPPCESVFSSIQAADLLRCPQARP